MQFLAPAALWLLLPVIAALLLSRRTSAPVRHLVGNLYLWARQATSDPSILIARRIRRNWLLILQAGFMTAVVFALARPLLHWSPPVVAFVIDVSASMGATDGEGSRLDSVRKECTEVIERLPWRSRVRLIRAGATAQHLGEYSRGDARLITALEALRVTAGAADLDGALNLARMASPGAARTVVFTDHAPDAPLGDATQWVTAGRPVDNLAVTGLAARRSARQPRDGEVVIAISNFGTAALDVPVELLMENRVVARLLVKVASGGTASAAIAIPNIEGVLRARIQQRDGLSLDNERVTFVPPLRPVRVLLVGGQSAFLERALASHPRVALQRAATAGAGAEAAKSDIVVCDPCNEVVAGAGGVLQVSRQGELQPPQAITLNAAEHPLAASLEFGGLFTPVRLGPRAPDTAIVVLRAGGIPALVASERDGLRVVDLRLDLDSPSLAMTTVFPALVDNIIHWLDAPRAAGDVVAGTPIEVRIGDTPAEVEIRRPDGTMAKTSRRGAVVMTTETEVAGVYTATSGIPIAVNAATATESNVAAPVPRLSFDNRSAIAGERGDGGSQFAPHLLMLGLALLYVEWWYRWRSPVRG